MFTGSYDAYDILGIDRNADKKTIKRAYAALVKQYHPEEQPEEWKRIHDAYEFAMKLASEQKPKHFEMPQASEQKAKIPILPKEQEDEWEAVFEDAEKRAKRHLSAEAKEKSERLDYAMKEIQWITWQKKMKLIDWKNFFEQKDILPIVSQNIVLREMGDCLTLKTIDTNLYRYFIEQLDKIDDYLKAEDINLGNRNISGVEYARVKVEEGHTRWIYVRQEQKKITACIGIILIVLFTFFITYIL